MRHIITIYLKGNKIYGKKTVITVEPGSGSIINNSTLFHTLIANEPLHLTAMKWTIHEADIK